LTGTNRAVVCFYNQPGTAEQRIKEGKAPTQLTGLLCHRFRANELCPLLGPLPGQGRFTFEVMRGVDKWVTRA